MLTIFTYVYLQFTILYADYTLELWGPKHEYEMEMFVLLILLWILNIITLLELLLKKENSNPLQTNYKESL